MNSYSYSSLKDWMDFHSAFSKNLDHTACYFAGLSGSGKGGFIHKVQPVHVSLPRRLPALCPEPARPALLHSPAPCRPLAIALCHPTSTESAAAYPKSSAGLPTPTMISLTFGGALNVPFLYHLRPLFVLGSQPAKAAAQGCQHFIWHGRISSLKSLLFML